MLKSRKRTQFRYIPQKHIRWRKRAEGRLLQKHICSYIEQALTGRFIPIHPLKKPWRRRWTTYDLVTIYLSDQN